MLQTLLKIAFRHIFRFFSVPSVFFLRSFPLRSSFPHRDSVQSPSLPSPWPPPCPSAPSPWPWPTPRSRRRTSSAPPSPSLCSPPPPAPLSGLQLLRRRRGRSRAPLAGRPRPQPLPPAAHAPWAERGHHDVGVHHAVAPLHRDAGGAAVPHHHTLHLADDDLGAGPNEDGRGEEARVDLRGVPAADADGSTSVPDTARTALVKRPGWTCERRRRRWGRRRLQRS